MDLEFKAIVGKNKLVTCSPLLLYFDLYRSKSHIRVFLDIGDPYVIATSHYS